MFCVPSLQEIKYEAPAPITQPVFGVPTEQTPPDTTNYGTNQVYNPQAYQQQQQQQQPQQVHVSLALGQSESSSEFNLSCINPACTNGWKN